MICSSREAFLHEVYKLKNIFWKNGYSNSFFDKMYQSFEKRQIKAKETIKEVGDRRYILKIPYVGSISHDFNSKVSQLFYNHLRVPIFPVFTTFKVSNYFSLKSQTPKPLTSNVVYKFTCLCDTNLTYIGKTKRHLVTRSLEHLVLEHAEKSEVKEHIRKCQVCKASNLNQFSILKKCRSVQETKIYEALTLY